MEVLLVLLFLGATIALALFTLSVEKDEGDSNLGVIPFLIKKIPFPWGWIITIGYVALGLYLVSKYK